MNFAYRTITLYGSAFQRIQLFIEFLTSRKVCNPFRQGPTTPDVQRLQALTYIWFRLFPFRSPLLWESRLLSFPEGT